LNPKPLKNLLKEFSQKYEDPSLVEDLINYYWSTIRKLVANKEHFYINLRGLGHFTVNEKRLNKVLAKNHAHLESLNPKEFKSFARYDNVFQDLQKASRLKDMIVQENKRMYTIKSKRREDRRNKQNQNNLEE
jgi:hypothetical protein